MNRKLTIISGLPRSGTSAMMQMLVAADMEVLTDDVRTADSDNPNGYYELELVQKIEHDKSWLPSAQGKVLKMVSPLLTHLPDEFDYDIIFMRRDLNEIIASQSKMIENRKTNGTDLNNENLIRTYKRHLKDIYTWMGPKTNIRTISIQYQNLIKNPNATAVSLVNFLDTPLDTTAMAAVIDAKLYRNRAIQKELASA